jgi:hypothetical protein
MKMSLEGWLSDSLIAKHRPSARGIAELLHICDRDLEKVKITELGPDWRLSIAHNAAVQAAKAALAKQVRHDVEQWLRAHYPSLAREI